MVVYAFIHSSPGVRGGWKVDENPGQPRRDGEGGKERETDRQTEDLKRNGCQMLSSSCLFP
jgi:hypothetical protein